MNTEKKGRLNRRRTRRRGRRKRGRGGGSEGGEGEGKLWDFRKEIRDMEGYSFLILYAT